MVEAPRKRKIPDFSIDRIVDKKRRNKGPPVAVPMASTVPEDRLSEEEDDDGLPAISFLPRPVRDQIQRNTNSMASSHDGIPTADQLQPSLMPISEQRQSPVYVVEEEGILILLNHNINE